MDSVLIANALRSELTAADAWDGCTVQVYDKIDAALREATCDPWNTSSIDTVLFNLLCWRFSDIQVVP